jgi:mitochondrial chaperone BCS1
MTLPEPFSELIGFLKANDFASGGLLVGFAGVVIAALRNLPGRIVRFLWRQVSLEVVIQNDTDLFDAVEHWLARKGTSGWQRVFAAKYRFSAPSLSDDEAAECEDPSARRKTAGLELSPGYGHHWFWYTGRPVLLHRATDGEKKADYFGKTRETFSLYFLGRAVVQAEAFLRDAIAFCNPPEARMVRVFTAQTEDWRVSAVSRVRPPESVVLREGTLDRLVADVRRFFDRESWYTTLGIPYRRGYLFTGPPGNGKTTTVLTLAGVFQAPVCILDLANPLLSDDKLRVLMNSAPAGAFFLLEDIDALFRSRKEPVKSKRPDTNVAAVGITFSGLLNALDGVMAPHGRVVFMSTNHPERLDPALIRPGRVDLRVEFPNADRTQGRQMFLRFFDDATDQLAERFAAAVVVGDHSMAAIQGLLLESAERPERAVQLACERSLVAGERPPSRGASGTVAILD